ncbi:DUF624 domain-containing protein [Streptococcus thoraltensis]
MKIVESKWYSQLIKISDYILIGLLWSLVSLPLVTIFSSLNAVFRTFQIWKTETTGNIIYHFFRGFKKHFLKLTLLNILVLLYVMFIINRIEGLISENSFFLGVIVFSIIVAISFLYQFILLASVNDKISFNIFVKATNNCVLHFFSNVIFIILTIGLVIVGFKLPHLFLVLVPIYLYLVYLNSKLTI